MKVYESDGGAEIRVGRTAADNDELSTDPAHRDGDDWWLHAAGCPGSHVVVRADTVAADELPRDVELDAAVLAANLEAALGVERQGRPLPRAPVSVGRQGRARPAQRRREDAPPQLGREAEAGEVGPARRSCR